MKNRVMAAALVCILSIGISACGGSVPESNAASEAASEAEQKAATVEFTDVTLLDNDLITVELAEFFEEEQKYSGEESPRMEKFVTLKVHNKSDKEILFKLNDAYINDESVSVAMYDGNSGPAPGKTKTYTYVIRYENGSRSKALASIDDLYTLDANIQTYVNDGKYLTDERNKRVCIKDILEGTGEADDSNEDKEKYAAVIKLLSDGRWFFNGGSNLILSYINFTEDKAVIGGVSFDGNGLHDEGVKEYGYTISDTDVTVSRDGGELVIPYSAADDGISLGAGEYFTLSEVEAALQGYWKFSYYSFGKHEGYLQVDHGKLKSESAAAASGGGPGDYYYYGPYEGTYTLGVGCFETDMFKGTTWFFNIIKGVPTILYYDNVCVPASGFAGEKGYSF